MEGRGDQVFYLKVFFLIVLIVTLLYLLNNKPGKEMKEEVEEDITADNITEVFIEEAEEPITVEEQPIAIEPVPPPVAQPVPQPVAQPAPQPTPEELKAQEMQQLIQRYNLPDSLKADLFSIEEIGQDILKITKKLSNDTPVRYVYVPSKEEVTEITGGTFKFVYGNKTYYFVNGVYYEYEKYQIFRIDDEVDRLLGRNLNYRQSNEIEKIIYVCQLTPKSFMALIGSESSYDKAQMYFFDTGVDKVRFVSLAKEEALQFKDVECIS